MGHCIKLPVVAGIFQAGQPDALAGLLDGVCGRSPRRGVTEDAERAAGLLPLLRRNRWARLRAARAACHRRRRDARGCT